MAEGNHIMSNEELAQPASKGDIVRLHEKMDEFAKAITVMSTAIAVLQSRPVYIQPCEFFKSHVADHKSVSSDWRKSLINGVVTIVVSLVVASTIYHLGITK